MNYYPTNQYWNQTMNPNHSGSVNSAMTTVEPYLGFIRGNLFQNLYDSYKNYQPVEMNPNNEQEYSLLLVQIYEFATHELTLYLDNYPNDKNAIQLRAQYQALYENALKEYEQKYGAITLTSDSLNRVPWNWLETRWPWEVK